MRSCSLDLNESILSGRHFGILYSANVVLLSTMTTGSSSSGVVVGLIYALDDEEEIHTVGMKAFNVPDLYNNK